jgi:hypothetical protein
MVSIDYHAFRRIDLADLGTNRLPAQEIAMLVDKGNDFPEGIEQQLLSYGDAMWAFRPQPTSGTTRALNSYLGEHRK